MQQESALSVFSLPLKKNYVGSLQLAKLAQKGLQQ